MFFRNIPFGPFLFFLFSTVSTISFWYEWTDQYSASRSHQDVLEPPTKRPRTEELAITLRRFCSFDKHA